MNLKLRTSAELITEIILNAFRQKKKTDLEVDKSMKISTLKTAVVL